MSDGKPLSFFALRREILTHFTSSNSLVLLSCFSSWIFLKGQKLHWNARCFLCFTWKPPRCSDYKQALLALHNS